MTAIPLLLYAAAAAAYAVHFGRRSDVAGRCATLVLGCATLTHVFVIGMQTMESGHLPVVGTSGAISGFVVLLALAYLYTEMMTNERSMGVFIVPAMAVLQAIPTLTNAVATRPAVLDSQWLAVHVLSLLFALRQLRIGLRDRRHLRPVVQGVEGEAPWVFLLPAALAPCARRHERAGRHGRLALSDRRARGRRHLADAGAAGGGGPAGYAR